MVATLHMYIQVHCYCTAPIDPTLVHISMKLFVSDTNSYKVMDINLKTIKMATICQLTTAMTSK